MAVNQDYIASSLPAASWFGQSRTINTWKCISKSQSTHNSNELVNQQNFELSIKLSIYFLRSPQLPHKKDQPDLKNIAASMAASGHIPIPSPRGIPFLGNIYDIDSSFPFYSMEQLAEQYGIYSVFELPSLR